MEDFVPFKLARKLKEKGFNKPCVAYYVSSCSKLHFNIAPLRGNTVEDCLISRNTQVCDVTLTDAPTISQVLTWLRKDKQLHISIDLMCNYSEDFDGNIREEWTYWSYSVHNIKEGPIYRDFNQLDHIEYESFKDAAIKGIEYALDNLI